MKVTARLPVHVRGTPIRNNGPRDIFVSRDMEWDIPEISSSETELAFESFDAFRAITDEDDPLKRALIHERFVTNVQAISYEGDLYRRLSWDGEDIPTMFSRAFPSGWDHESGIGFGGHISFRGFAPSATDRWDHPISLPVFRQLRWHMLSSSFKDTTIQNQETWPQTIPAAVGTDRGLFSRRNHVTFEEVLPKIVEYGHEQFEQCMRMHIAHMRTFLVVDGALWMKTKPPVYRVERRYEGQVRASATVSIVFAPDWHDVRVARAYFSLGAREEAFAFANRMCDALGNRKLTSHHFDNGQQVKTVTPAVRGDVVDYTSNHVVHDPSLAEYPHQEEELRRMSCGLAVEANRFLTRNPSWRERFGTDASDRVAASFAEVMATNYVLGEYGDASDQLASNATVWKKSRRGNSTYDFGEVNVADLLIERALGYEENKPIDVRAVHQPAPVRTI